VTYEDLVDQATTALDKEQNEEAIKLLTQAVQMDAAKPTAYAFLGWAELYGKGNPAGAEPFMRQAIERGGAAIFRATHDHDGLFTLTNTCKGSLFITKNEVTFKADDGGDTFEASDANIKEVKTNRLVGAQFGAFHLKLGDGKNYNFAPATKRQVEARMIISLIEGFK
jgi:TPR repeat protein